MDKPETLGEATVRYLTAERLDAIEASASGDDVGLLAMAVRQQAATIRGFAWDRRNALEEWLLGFEAGVASAESDLARLRTVVSKVVALLVARENSECSIDDYNNGTLRALRDATREAGYVC